MLRVSTAEEYWSAVAEMREHDGQQLVTVDTTTLIARQEVQDTQERKTQPPPRLVK